MPIQFGHNPIRGSDLSVSIGLRTTSLDSCIYSVLSQAARMGAEPGHRRAALLLRLERAVSSTDRRTSRMGARSLRSGPGGARIPVSWSSAKRYTVSATGPCLGDCTKKPDAAVTPGFVCFPSICGQVSQAQRMPGRRIRRIIGYTPLASRFGFETRPQGNHRSLPWIRWLLGFKSGPGRGLSHTLY